MEETKSNRINDLTIEDLKRRIIELESENLENDHEDDIFENEDFDSEDFDTDIEDEDSGGEDDGVISIKDARYPIEIYVEGKKVLHLYFNPGDMKIVEQFEKIKNSEKDIQRYLKNGNMKELVLEMRSFFEAAFYEGASYDIFKYNDYKFTLPTQIIAKCQKAFNEFGKNSEKFAANNNFAVYKSASVKSNQKTREFIANRK